MMVSDVPQIIESCGFCRAEKVKSLRAMKSGMTNRSYSFCMDDKRYIIRIPGEGTDRLINRKQEHAVYNAISSLGISEDVYSNNTHCGKVMTANPAIWTTELW